MSDSVEWLRNFARNYADGVAGMTPQEHRAWDIADEIERLRAAPREIRHVHTFEGCPCQPIARAALEPRVLRTSDIIPIDPVTGERGK